MKKLLLFLLLLPLSLSAQMTVRSNMSQFTPSLNLDFMQGVMSPNLTFTRSGTATVTTSTGSLSVVGANVPRFDYDLTAATVTGQNLLSYSEQFDDASWTKNATTVTPNVATNPFGQLTADLVAASSTTVNSGLINKAVPSTHTFGTYTYSVYAKKGSSSGFKMQPNAAIDNVTTGTSANFNLVTGTATMINPYGGKFANVSASMQFIADGWYRCQLTYTVSGLVPPSGVSQWIYPYLSGDATGSDMYLWGAMVNAGTSALPYVATTAGVNFGTLSGVSLKGLLIEEQRTNIYQNSNSPTLWSKAANTVQTGYVVAIAPDGITTVPGYSNQSGVSGCTITIPQVTALSYSTTYTRSLYVKPLGTSQTGNLTWVFESSIGNNGNPVYAVSRFNLATGVITNDANVVSASIQNVGNGWYRCIQTFTTQTAGGISGGQNYPAGYGATPSVATFAIWGAQLELGTFATSLIPTISYTSTVTRGLEQLSMPSSPWYNTNEGTILCRAFTDTPNVDMRLLSIDDGTNGPNRIVIQRGLSNNLGGFGVTQGTSVGFGSGITVATGNLYACLSYRPNDYRSAYNGSAGSAGTGISVPSGITTLRLNTGGGRFWHQKVQYWPTRRPNSYLQSQVN